MSILGIVIAAMIVGGTGLFIGLFLGIAEKKFAVETDEREDAILEILPGNNCGGCGYAGCAALAAAIVQGEANTNACPVGGTPVVTLINEIMGQETKSMAREVAFVKCAGTTDKASQDYNYHGTKNCTMMKFMQAKGPKGCKYGCHGYGSCVEVCQFDAIHIVNGVAVVDTQACKACKMCIGACPRDLIELIPYTQKQVVMCASKEKGKDVMQVCSVGCIGCKLCEKACEFNAIQVEDNIAKIDYEKCTNCGACAEKCPKKCIK